MTDPNADLPGTTYLAPNNNTYRLRAYEVDVFSEDENPPTTAVYDYWSAQGGAASGCYTLPEGCVRVVIPTPDRPAPGSLFLASDGTAYRLRNYGVDWTAEPFTGEHTKASYTVMLTDGASTNTDHLPADARLVWSPTDVPS